MVTCLDGCRVGTLPDGDKWQTGHQSAAQARIRTFSITGWMWTWTSDYWPPNIWHPFMRLSKPLASLTPLIIATRDQSSCAL